MHRSGTSALARVIDLAGWTKARTMMRPSEANRLGHWESSPIVSLNNRLMGMLDRVWADPKPLPEGWRDRAELEAVVDEAADLVGDQFGDADRIVIKDPRFSRLLPLWRTVFEKRGYRPHFVVACRNPLEVAGSLRKRDAMQRNHAILLWQSYMTEAEYHTRDRPRTLVHFGDLLADWRSVLHGPGMTDIVGPDGIADDVAEAIDGFLSPRHRHEEVSDGDFFRSKRVWAPVRKLYALFKDTERGLDAVSDEFDELRAVWAKTWLNRSPDEGASIYRDKIPLFWIQQSRENAEDGALEDAIAAARKAVEIDPRIARHQYHLGSLLEQNEEIEEAERAYARAVKLYGEEPRYLRSWARTLRRFGRSEDAANAMRQLLAIEPDHAEDYLLLGRMLAEDDRPEEAADAFGRAIELAPAKAEYLKAYSETLLRADRPEAAVEIAERAVKSSPDNPELLRQLAKSLVAARKLDRAEKMFEKAIARGGTDPDYLHPYQALLARRGKYRDAIELTRRCIAAEPAVAKHHCDLADLQLGIGNLHGAAYSQSRAVELSRRAIGLANGGNDAAGADELETYLIDGETFLRDREQVEELAILLSWNRAQELAGESCDSGFSDIEGFGAGPAADAAIGTPPPVRSSPSHDTWRSKLAGLIGANRRRPLVSVMIPVHNVADPGWLRQSLESLVAQKLDAGEIEIMVVDDASDDDRAKTVAEEFSPQVRFIANKSNLGIVDNHNRCLNLARGEFIHVLHQDDFVGEGFYRKLLPPLMVKERLVAAFCRARTVDADGRHRGDQPILQQDPGVVDNFTRKIAARQQILFPAIIVRRSAYERIGGFLPASTFAFDWEMWARLSALGEIWYDPEILCSHREHQSSTTNSMGNLERLIDGIRIAAFNASHLPPSQRRPTLATSIYRLLLRDWHRILREEFDTSDSPTVETWVTFLIGGSLGNRSKHLLANALSD
ncbi:tetratricopeptide repeat protein [Parasphingopyxis algicola]|uniref:glycosyltransferase n=1 Tax=Parasphingopyxis algicola TaxID=2026624 RepID=UPI0015A4B597|nr:tetratricopeptide repeat protein [Parasphingopyxis algicola]QLC26037.1 tetratricopeptide repeat protein [Parasphingopyxis algicola]